MSSVREFKKKFEIDLFSKQIWNASDLATFALRVQELGTNPIHNLRCHSWFILELFNEHYSF